jgi:selenide,water dikinase
VKPVAGLWQRWQELHGRVCARETGEDYRIAVVGGGAGSVELAMAMANRLAGNPVGIDLWCGAAEILQNYNGRAQAAVMSALQRQGIRVHLNARVEQVEEACLVMADGSRPFCDWCPGYGCLIQKCTRCARQTALGGIISACHSAGAGRIQGIAETGGVSPENG